eukprot:TRINITY_DN55565_c0_g1_i1.p2 TRINITY_DN55565_c0_g1~~TRINITY_DN55565_c0_g1_i1.p2  ORF type:complete len:242 (-),score=20.73 TRINITY_DN55565_c0_g1_i1:923-1648(-)
MQYRYKTSSNNEIIDRKARCAVRGDLMIPTEHLNPEQTASYNVDKTTTRVVLSLAAQHRLHLEHFDIKGAYLHEQFENHKPVYIRQPPRFDGSFKHKEPFGELIGNLYGTPSAAFLYSRGLYDHLTSHGYTPLKSDPNMFFQKSGPAFIIIGITTDDFLAAASHSTLLGALSEILNAKYTVKRLGQPTKYIGWNFDYSPRGFRLHQNHLIDALASRLHLSNANPVTSPFADGIDPQNPQDP